MDVEAMHQLQGRVELAVEAEQEYLGYSKQTIWLQQLLMLWVRVDLLVLAVLLRQVQTGLLEGLLLSELICMLMVVDLVAVDLLLRQQSAVVQAEEVVGRDLQALTLISQEDNPMLFYGEQMPRPMVLLSAVLVPTQAIHQAEVPSGAGQAEVGQELLRYLHQAG